VVNCEAVIVWRLLNMSEFHNRI